ncbi:MAG: GT4 family glycosyltransferase PelF, partial [Myxococcota bacterium]
FEHGTPMILTDHGVYARERYIACSAAPFSLFSKRFLARLALLFSKLCYYYADVIAPCAHFNARWELPVGCVLDRETPIDFSSWENTGIVPNLTEFPFIRPTYDALVDFGFIENYEEDTEYPWIRTIYNGVDTERFRPGEKPDHVKGIPTAVALARVFPLKDVLTMIRSCAVAKREIPNVKYIVYGSLKADPPYVAKCNALIEELGLQENFDLAGYHSKPNEAFWEGDISVLSSISEGFPFTVLESMAAGVPVVGTDVGGVKEGIGTGADACGVVVPPRDPEAFGAGVIQLLKDDRLRSELARKGRERILRLFQTSTSVDAYAETYRRLAAIKAERRSLRGVA